MDIPFYERVNKPNKIVLESSFTLPDSLLNNTEEIALVFQKVIGNEMKVYLNDKVIYVVGSESGNIWPSPIVVRLPKDVLSEYNTVRLELFALINYGISYLPYVTTLSDAQGTAWLQRALRSDLNLFGIGVAAIIGYIMLFISTITNGPQRKQYLYLGLSSLFTIAGLIQFVYRETSGSILVYLLLEKLGIALPNLSATLIYFFIIERYDKKNRKLFLNVLLYISIIILVVILLPLGSQTFNVLYNASNLYSLFLIGITVWTIFKYRISELVFPLFFLYMTAIQSITVLVLGFPDELLLPYGRIVFMIFISTEAIKNFKDLSRRKEYLEKENYIDQLTGAYNRKVIETLDKQGTLILIDLDDFKKVNDSYGHKKGDEMLKRFSNLVIRNIREDDYFIRLGGDEFCIVTKRGDSKQVINRIYNLSKNELNLGFSCGIVNLSEYEGFDKAYIKADEHLYENKRARRSKPY